MPPVDTVVVPADTPFLYKVMVVVEGLEASSLAQVPLTVTFEPMVIGLFNVGACVQGAPGPDPPELILVVVVGG